jgi:hypothetical protein
MRQVTKDVKVVKQPLTRGDSPRVRGLATLLSSPSIPRASAPVPTYFFFGFFTYMSSHATHRAQRSSVVSFEIGPWFS